MKINKITALCFAAVSLLGNITAMFFLPDKITMQLISASSDATVLPTPVGLLMLTAIVLICALRLYFEKEEKGIRWIILISIILIANLITVFFNIK